MSTGTTTVSTSATSTGAQLVKFHRIGGSTVLPTTLSSYARDQYCNRFSKLDWQDFCHYRSTAILPTCTTTMSKRAPSAPPKYNMAIEARTFELVHDASMAFDIAAESLLGDCDGACLYADRLTVHSRYEHMVIGAVPCIASNLTRGSTIACSHFSWGSDTAGGLGLTPSPYTL